MDNDNTFEVPYFYHVDDIFVCIKKCFDFIVNSQPSEGRVEMSMTQSMERKQPGQDNIKLLEKDSNFQQVFFRGVLKILGQSYLESNWVVTVIA